jgi:hypothetical protein
MIPGKIMPEKYGMTHCESTLQRRANKIALHEIPIVLSNQTADVE